MLERLQNLEHRVCDSVGIATVADDKLWSAESTGKLAEVQQDHCLEQLPGNTGMGRVGWGTLGRVTCENAHPDLDCQREIPVVHSGIIDNYQGLPQQLQSRHRFVSETDTKLCSHLIEEHMQAGASLEQAMGQTAKRLWGFYDLLAVFVGEPEKIAAAC